MTRSGQLKADRWAVLPGRRQGTFVCAEPGLPRRPDLGYPRATDNVASDPIFSLVHVVFLRRFRTSRFLAVFSNNRQ